MAMRLEGYQEGYRTEASAHADESEALSVIPIGIRTCKCRRLQKRHQQRIREKHASARFEMMAFSFIRLSRGRGL